MYHPSPAAYHEAGHALTAFIYHRGPLKVQLTSKDGGRVLATEYDDRTPHLIAQDIEISLSGAIAEFLAFGTGAGIDNDISDALSHLRKLNPKARLRDLQPYIRKLTDALSDPTTWSKVQALAEQLQQQRSLTYDQIKEILRQDHPAARPPHAGAKITLAPNPHYQPEKLTKAVVVNKDGRTYAVQHLPSLPI